MAKWKVWVARGTGHRRVWPARHKVQWKIWEGGWRETKERQVGRACSCCPLPGGNRGRCGGLSRAGLLWVTVVDRAGAVHPEGKWNGLSESWRLPPLGKRGACPHLPWRPLLGSNKAGSPRSCWACFFSHAHSLNWVIKTHPGLFLSVFHLLIWNQKGFLHRATNLHSLLPQPLGPSLPLTPGTAAPLVFSALGPLGSHLPPGSCMCISLWPGCSLPLPFYWVNLFVKPCKALSSYFTGYKSSRKSNSVAGI